MQPLKWLRKLVRNQRGNALVVCAATLPLVIGSAAIGVDTVQVSLARRQMQRAADSAAIAGAYAAHAQQNVNTAVNRDLGLNEDLTVSNTVIENAPTVGSYAGNMRAVRVVLTAQRAVPFISFFTGSTMTVTTEATATSIYRGEYCAISLEDAAVNGAIDLTGNATVNLGCGMISNSTGSSAVTAGGSSVVTASPMAAVGGVPPSTNYGPNTTLLPYQPEQEDPFAGLPTPTVPGGCDNQALSVQPGDTYTVTSSDDGHISSGTPNVYCWRGMDIKGTVNLPAGSIVYLDGGDFDVNSQGVVNGQQITFILTASNAATQPGQIGDLNINAGATLNLTAPDSGTYSGVLFYQDRRAEYGTTHINGNASTFLRGAFYFPRRQLQFNGTAGMQTTCLQLVARRLAFSGNSSISNSCPAGSGSGGFDFTRVFLVG